MSWQEQWHALSCRIGGLLEAVKVFAALFQITADETRMSGKYEHINRVLLPQAKEVFVAVSGLCVAYGDVLPSSATAAVQFYTKQLEGAPATGLAGLLGMATILAAMKSELDYLLADQDAATVAAIERAFEHLQRTIVVDHEQRKRWHMALGKETQCEKIGAIHLLWHGIWAFKISAAGERTDLVLGIPIGEAIAERIRASGSRLVLTEWKLVRQANRLSAAIKQAITQLRLYSQGSLGGIELRTARYVVVVSASRLTMPSDYAIDSVLYRFVNIVTAPQPPSVSPSDSVREVI